MKKPCQQCGFIYDTQFEGNKYTCSQECEDRYQMELLTKTRSKY